MLAKDELGRLLRDDGVPGGVRERGLALPRARDLVTGHADQAVSIRALRAGMRDIVPKTPDFLDYLPTAVDRVVSQVRVERKLAESELRLASIVGTTMDAILMCDADARVVLFNRSAEQLFGCAAPDALARPIAELLPDLRLEHRSSPDAHFRKAARARRRAEGWQRRSARGVGPRGHDRRQASVHGHRARHLRAEAELRETWRHEPSTRRVRLRRTPTCISIWTWGGSRCSSPATRRGWST